jgi:hypothetical protein
MDYLTIFSKQLATISHNQTIAKKKGGPKPPANFLEQQKLCWQGQWRRTTFACERHIANHIAEQRINKTIKLV